MRTERANPRITTERDCPAPGRLWQIPVFVLGLLTALGVWASRPWWYDADLHRFRHDLAQARRLLEQPAGDLAQAPPLLEDALARADRYPDSLGEIHFLLGSAYLRLAAQPAAPDAAGLLVRARRHLEEAERSGVPPAAGIRLAGRLARVWYRTGADPRRVVAYLTLALEGGDEDRAEAFAILTQCYLHLPEPDLRSALQANERLLQLPNLDDRELSRARLLSGELLLKLQDREAARKVLARIGAEALPSVYARARLLRAQSLLDDERWAEAAPLWEEIRNDTAQPPVDPGRAAYALGLCYRNTGRPADAVRCWEQARSAGGEEGQAALLRLAQLRAEVGNWSAAQELYAQALAGVNRPADYRNSLLDLAQLKNGLHTACRAALEAKKYEDALTLAQLHARLVPAATGQTLVGEVSEAWGRSGPTDAAGQRHLREAGAAFEAAADAANDPPARAEGLWRAADNYFAGGDPARTAHALTRYLDIAPREQAGEAWFSLGRAYLTLGDEAKAAGAYRNCITFPGRFAYRARYQLALLDIKHGRHAEAEETLRQNLDAMVAEPDQDAQEQSLYALAGLLYDRGEYALAAPRFERALQYYPTHEDVHWARYLLAQCYRRQAEAEFERSKQQHPLLPRNHDQAQRQQHYLLWQAKASLAKLVADLDERRSHDKLTAREAEILRRGLLDLADCTFKLGEYQAALDLYEDIYAKYQKVPQGLTALKELWRCHISLVPLDQAKHLSEAHRALDRLQRALIEIGSALPRDEGEETRAYWERWLADNRKILGEYEATLRPNGPR